MQQRRLLTSAERSVIDRLLSVEFPEVDYFRAQADAITVVGECGCGCGTITLAVDTDKAPRAPSPAWNRPTDPIVEGDSSSWLMLFQRDGTLNELEHVAGYGPNPEQLDASQIEPDLQVDEDWFER